MSGRTFNPLPTAQPMTSPLWTSEPVHIAAGVEQGSDRLEVPVRGREMQRRGIVALVSCVGVGAVLEQHAHGIDVRDGRVECGAALFVALVNEGRLTPEHGAERRGIPRSARREQRVARRVFRYR